ncbi:cytochrome b [Aestuariibius sp. 2305UL40-4]|uniref:cytochrome b n=1 Tax=Aestuariibius violaceus TaxID=3234132 RepID=UPI00345E317B
MPPADETEPSHASARYTPLQITLHWLTAALLVALVGSGLAYSADLAERAAIWVHQVSGQILILVVALRFVVRFFASPLPADPDHAVWERRLAAFTHLGLYVTLIAMAATGYVAASALGHTALALPVSQSFARSDAGEALLFAHFALKWVLLALVGLHLAGVLKHALQGRDGTLSRMTFQPRKEKENA